MIGCPIQNFIVKLKIINVKMMKINQRNHYQVEQKLPKSKIIEKYKNHLEYLIENSEVSFDSIKTPGWTSLVNTQQSKDIINNFSKQQSLVQKADSHQQILSRLNSLPKLNADSNFFSKIRVNSSSNKNKNLIVYGSAKIEEKKKNQTPKSNQTNKFVNRFSTQGKLNYVSLQKNRQSAERNSSRKNISSVRSQPHTNLKQRIRQRLSGDVNRNFYVASDFQSNLNTDINKKVIKIQKSASPVKFYSKTHNFDSSKQQKHEYLNRYLNKLHKRSQSTSSLKNQKKEVHNDVNKKNKVQIGHKRFNTITVYDHLYGDSFKLQSKRNMQKMIDQSYKRANILTFTPQISQKTNLLALSKFSRLEDNSQLHQSHENCGNKKSRPFLESKHQSNSIYTIHEQITSKQKQKMAQKMQNRTFTKLFSILSNSGPTISEKTLQVNIQKLPLALIELIEPILTRVYQKIVFTLEQFLLLISSQKGIKQVASKRNVIVAQTQRYLRWIRGNEHKEKENNLKQINQPNHYQPKHIDSIGKFLINKVG